MKLTNSMTDLNEETDVLETLATSLDRIADAIMELAKTVDNGSEGSANELVSNALTELSSVVSTEAANLRGEYDEDDED